MSFPVTMDARASDTSSSWLVKLSKRLLAATMSTDFAHHPTEVSMVSRNLSGTARPRFFSGFLSQ